MSRFTSATRILAAILFATIFCVSPIFAKSPSGFSSSSFRSSNHVTAAAPTKAPSGFSFSADHAKSGEKPSVPSPEGNIPPPQKGILDGAASKAISERSFNDYQKLKTPTPGPAAPQTTVNAGAPFVPAPPTAAPTHTYQYPRYNGPVVVTRNSSGDFINGMLLQSLFSTLEHSHDRAEIDRLRGQLAVAHANTADPRMSALLDDELTKTEPENNPFVSTNTTAPSTNTSEQKSSSFGWFWPTLIVLAMIAIAAYFFNKTSNKPKSPSGKYTPPLDETAFQATKIGFKAGGSVTISEVPFILLSAAGSSIGDLSGARSIISIGSFKIGDVTVERAYLSGGKSFLERAIDTTGTNSRQMRIYTKTYEDFPATPDDWEAYLGNTEPGLIGQVNITVPPLGISYDRIWGDGDNAIAPICIRETITTSPDAKSQREHLLMEYARRLGDKEDGASEYLYIGKTSDNGGASIQLWTGVDLEDSSITIT